MWPADLDFGRLQIMTSFIRSTVVIAAALAGLWRVAGANEYCATPEQSQAIREFYAGKPGTLPVIAARRLGLPDALVTSGLPGDQAVSAPGSAFADVWAAMTAWQQANFLIMKGQNVFEILSGVAAGAPSKRSSYFNIAYEHPLRGHLRPDLYGSIYALDMPGDGETPIRGVLFFDTDGALVFGAFISGEALQPGPGEMEKFAAVWDLVEGRPSVCMASSEN
jgi:putative heme iron utilization protein